MLQQSCDHYNRLDRCMQIYHCNGNDKVTAKENFYPLSGPVKLFDKVITKSDIKQNRLAIPKHQAKKHFPVHDASTSKGALLCMKDNEGKMWRFRYKLWKSSQGYVLTSEWNQFVKKKGVREGDVVSFLRSATPDVQLFIEWKPQVKSEAMAKSEVFEPGHQAENFKLFGVNIPINHEHAL